MPNVSIIIPTYNEYNRIIPTLRKVVSFLERGRKDYEIIVSDDGSSDGTSDLIEREFRGKKNIRVLRHSSNHGKGYVVREGMLEAKGDFRLFMDADLSTPIEELDKLTTYFRLGFDVVIGSRAIADDEVEINKTVHRYLMGKIFNTLVSIFVIGGISDTQCGFKMFTSKATHDLFSRQKLDGFSFDVEVLYLAKKLGYRIKEVPVSWADAKDSKVKLLHDSIAMAKDLFKVRKLHKAGA